MQDLRLSQNVQVFWDVMLCHSITCFWHKGLHCHHIQGHSVILDCLLLKMKATWSFETRRSTHLATQCYIPEDLKPCVLMHNVPEKLPLSLYQLSCPNLRIKSALFLIILFLKYKIFADFCYTIFERTVKFLGWTVINRTLFIWFAPIPLTHSVTVSLYMTQHSATQFVTQKYLWILYPLSFDVSHSIGPPEFCIFPQILLLCVKEDVFYLHQKSDTS
jgi:hypothetical protein